AFGVPLAGALLTWNVLARVDSPTVGPGGFRWMAATVAQSLSQNARGWAPDGQPRPDHPDYATYASWLREPGSPSLTHSIAACANLVFYHLWFPDNAWRETLVLSPAALIGLH